MPKYRKRPVVIEAWRWPESRSTSDLPPWLEDALNAEVAYWADIGSPHGGSPDSLVIKTLEGRITASPGDWIIKGVKGELYPCKPDIFALTYEPDASTDGDQG